MRMTNLQRLVQHHDGLVQLLHVGDDAREEERLLVFVRRFLEGLISGCSCGVSGRFGVTIVFVLAQTRSDVARAQEMK